MTSFTSLLNRTGWGKEEKDPEWVLPMGCSYSLTALALVLSTRKRLLQPGVICGLQCGCLLPWVLHRLQGDRSCPWAAVEFLFLHLDNFLSLLVLCRGFLQGCLSHFSHSSSTASAQFFFYLGYIIAEAVLVMGTIFEQQRVCFGIGWDWLSPAWEQILLSSC